MKRLRILQTACALASLLMLAACTQDELTDSNGTSLPEGKYPLEIAGVTVTAASGSEPWDTSPAHAPQTRVAENADGNSSKWTDGDEIGVKIGEAGAAGAYTVNVDGSGKVTGLTAKTPVYWASTTEATVSAWYPTTNGTLDLSDQSNGLKYAMTGSGTGTYANSVSLSFTHRLAKVCVELTGDAETVKKVTSIGVKGYKKCTVTNGQVSDGTETGYISMRQPVPNGKYWEANLAPQTISKSDFLQINGESIAVKTEATQLKEGNSYVFTIDVSDGTLKPNEDGKFIVKADDDVIIKNYNGSASIEVKGEGTTTITIDNVQLTSAGSVMTVEKGMTVELKVVGTNNTFTSTNGCGIELQGNYREATPFYGANITITGESQSTSSLEVTASGENYVGIGANTSGCGNIKIENIALTVTGGTPKSGAVSGPAAIGIGNTYNYGGQSCGNITITNSNVTATSTGGACIGTGCLSYSFHQGNETIVGTIAITGSTITATANPRVYVGSKNYGACIGTGSIVNMSCTIAKIDIQSTTLNLTTGGGAYKVWTGENISSNSSKLTITNGIKVGNTEATIGWNSDTDYN
ncbi:MAG: fimbrillin family protein [Parabacteroides gordonii]|nr:fimbrillin family protein [Parabacteroides gordonii]